MSPAELAVFAALGGSALTGMATLGITWFREWLRGRAADRDTLGQAITQMLSQSMAVMMTVQAMGQTMRIRSGLGEGLDVATRLRKPADPMELYGWLAKEIAPLNEAWSVIWLRGDQGTIRLANELLNACSEVIGEGTQRQPTANVGVWLRRWAVGERQTPEMEAELQAAIRTVARARERLAQHARRKLGLPAAELFSPDLPAAQGASVQAAMPNGRAASAGAETHPSD